MGLGARRLERCLEGETVVMGIGSRWHGDDAAGPAVVARLAGEVEARCIDAGDAPERHLGEAMQGRPEAIVLVDAVDFGGAPGEIGAFGADELPARTATTHDASLGLLMGMLERESGARVLLVGVQPASVRFGDPMSPAVSESVEALVGVLRAKLGRGRGARSEGARAGARGAWGQEGGQVC